MVKINSTGWKRIGTTAALAVAGFSVAGAAQAAPASGAQHTASVAQDCAQAKGVSVKWVTPAGNQEMNHAYYQIKVTNHGSSPCLLKRAPDLQPLTPGGHVVGAPAQVEPGMADGLRLQPGQSAEAQVDVVNPAMVKHGSGAAFTTNLVSVSIGEGKARTLHTDGIFAVAGKTSNMTVQPFDRS